MLDNPTPVPPDDGYRPFPALVALFFAEFHPIQGPRVAYEAPSGFLTGPSSEIDFESVSEYVIPKPQLCGRLVTLSYGSFKIMGYPVSIEDRKYERNALLFNVAFVFSDSDDCTSYERIVEKMARVFRSLELEDEFISKPKSKNALQNILDQVLADMNLLRECQIPISDANSINLKLFPNYNEPPRAEDYHVPVCITKIHSLMDQNWDLTMRKVIAGIDGVNHVKRIAEVSDVDLELVHKCIQHLLYYGCVVLIDIFQFGNVYTVLPNIKQLVEDYGMQTACLQYVSTQASGCPSFATIFSILGAMRHGVTLKEICLKHSEELQTVDIRRLVAFALVKGIIRRVHRYPFLTARVRGSGIPKKIRRLMSGEHHVDDIGVRCGISPLELDELISARPEIHSVWK